MNANRYNGVERRRDMTLEVLTEMREWFENHEEEEHRKFEAIRDELVEARRSSEDKHSELVERMERMSQSTLNVINEQNRALQEIHTMFRRSIPEGDADAHRRAHENWMKKAEADAQFWVKLKQHVINWAVVAAMGWVGIALWAAFLRGPA